MERLVLEFKEIDRKTRQRRYSSYLLLVFVVYFLLSCDSTESSTSQLAPIEEYQVPEHLEVYYDGVDFSLKANNLYDALAVQTISRHTNFLSYADRHKFLYDADADPNDSSNVVLIYSGERRDRREWSSPNNPHPTQTFNTEHVYPQSLLEGASVSDLHILRVVDARINSQRSNRPYARGTGKYALQDGFTFFPGDDWRGDVARMIFYVNMRYDEPFEDVGSLKLFLEWNAEDPVSPLERQRNDVIEGAQNNRNPFIDNPHLATAIWGGPPAQNLWEPMAE